MKIIKSSDLSGRAIEIINEMRNSVEFSEESSRELAHALGYGDPSDPLCPFRASPNFGIYDLGIMIEGGRYFDLMLCITVSRSIDDYDLIERIAIRMEEEK